MKLFSCGLFFLLSGMLYAQSPVVCLSKSPTAAEIRAAHVLQHYLSKMTGEAVNILTGVSPDHNTVTIFIGTSQAATEKGFEIPLPLVEDAYFLEGKNGSFALSGGGDLGAEYAVYSLLELLGCRKFSPRDSLIPHIEKLQLPDYPAKIESPAFPYRELWYEPAMDESWARWHKLKTNPQKNQEWGMFVHTFNKLCPPDQYFAEHPEYFAYNGAQRSQGQLCLSNDTVYQIVRARLQALMQEKPDARYWSVSQNDNYDYCKCPRCAANDRTYGSPAATLILFVNRIAAAFPEKTISTLAYQYTRKAPKGLTPASNVSICLCSIECNRGQSIETGCPDFARDVQEWSALTKNLMIWDYVVQFRSYLGPFPNWHTLQPNLQFFQQNGVKMMFEQGSGHDRSEFSDMRAYLLAKLMWNPLANMDSILTDFGNGFYGNARPGIWQYIHKRTEKMKKHDNRLWIYDVPQNEAFVKDSLFEWLIGIEEMIPRPGDSVQQIRLESVVISDFFSFLENLKCASPKDEQLFNTATVLMLEDSVGFSGLLEEFKATCKRTGYGHLNENGYTPDQYVQDYKAFILRSLEARQSSASAITLLEPASPQYAKGDPLELTNNLVGETDYRYNWLGFQGNDLQAVLEFSDTVPISYSNLQVSFLQDQASWIFYPEKVVFEISSDGQHFQILHEETLPLLPDGKKDFHTIAAKFPATAIKFLRVTATNTKKCPAWHTCNGNPCWIFADEIIVR